MAALAVGGAVTALGSDGEWLYLADDGARAWRVDPYADALTTTALFGDGVRGVFPAGAPPGLNRVGGIAYDAVRGVLVVSDTAENVVVTVQ